MEPTTPADDTTAPQEDMTVVNEPVAEPAAAEADGYYGEGDEGDNEVDLSFLDNDDASEE